MLTKIVAKKKDGSLIMGLTGDFHPFRNTFHIQEENQKDKAYEIAIDDLKAVFFVRRLEGSKTAHDRAKRAPEKPETCPGKRIKIIFHDDEEIEGYTLGYHIERLGFFITPLDKADNNERIFVVRSSIKEFVADGKTIDLSTIVSEEVNCNACGRRMELIWKYCPFDGAKI